MQIQSRSGSREVKNWHTRGSRVTHNPLASAKTGAAAAPEDTYCIRASQSNAFSMLTSAKPLRVSAQRLWQLQRKGQWHYLKPGPHTQRLHSGPPGRGDLHLGWASRSGLGDPAVRKGSPLCFIRRAHPWNPLPLLSGSFYVQCESLGSERHRGLISCAVACSHSLDWGEV